MDDQEFRDHVVGSLGYMTGQLDMLVDRVDVVEDLEPRVAVLEHGHKRKTTLVAAVASAVTAFGVALKEHLT